LSFYHLSGPYITIRILLPTHRRLERATLLLLRHIWHCNPQGLPGKNVAILTRELLPRVFTLTLTKSANTFVRTVIFCGTIHYRPKPISIC